MTYLFIAAFIIVLTAAVFMRKHRNSVSGGGGGDPFEGFRKTSETVGGGPNKALEGMKNFFKDGPKPGQILASAVAMIVSDPPPSMFRALPKNFFGLMSAEVSTPPEPILPEFGIALL